MFHFEISGKYSKDEQKQKIELSEDTLDKFHLEISGNDTKE